MHKTIKFLSLVLIKRVANKSHTHTLFSFFFLNIMHYDINFKGMLVENNLQEFRLLFDVSGMLGKLKFS